MKLLHLYHDIMNLYGDYANISAMERLLKKSGIEFSTDRLSFSDSADLCSYDFIYIGSGTEKNRNVVLSDIHRYRDDLVRYIESGKVILMTGNSFEMLGRPITTATGKIHKGLEIADFYTVEQNKTRVTGDAIFEASFLQKPLVGFINKCSEIEDLDEPLFTVDMGLGNRKNSDIEGFRRKNLFGTHLTGPVLIKNPHFLLYLAALIVGEDTPLSSDHLAYENAAFDITLKELSALKTNA